MKLRVMSGRIVRTLATVGLLNSLAPLALTQCKYYLYPALQGYRMRIVMSGQGMLGDLVSNLQLHGRSRDYFWPVGCQFPDDSPIEHLEELGIWVGALVDVGRPGFPRLAKLVTQTDYEPDTVLLGVNPCLLETQVSNPDTPWHHTSNLTDPTAISESDYTCVYTDTIPSLAHIPLGIKVTQTSHAWANAVRELILPFDCVLANIGNKHLKNLWIAFKIEPWVAMPGDTLPTDLEGYWPELLTSYVTNPVERLTPVGFTILSFPRPLAQLKYYYQWFYRDQNSIYTGIGSIRDSFRYDFMSGALLQSNQPIQPNQPESEPRWPDMLMSFGPIDSLNPGDTLKFSFAIIGGLDLKYGSENLYDNAAKVQTLFSRGYKPPLVLPSPNLRIDQGFRKVALRWGYDGKGVNPEDVWDDANRLVEFYPPDYWRRANPAPGHTTGGRVFQGYRLYRSEDPAGTARSFTLFREWSVIDSIGPQYTYSTGIETTFVDTNLLTGKVYWYAVTSFGMPDRHVIDYVDWDGTVKQETLATPSAESSILASRKRVSMTFSVSTQPGKVLVVPNPYRTDQNYTTEFGGYEGRSRSWTENDRLIKFIHLPAHCTIRIFTLAGDVIATLYHDDPVRGEMDWNLISESNRAIASGVYIFTVESDLGTQTGKFVVIR